MGSHSGSDDEHHHHHKHGKHKKHHSGHHEHDHHEYGHGGGHGHFMPPFLQGGHSPHHMSTLGHGAHYSPPHYPAHGSEHQHHQHQYPGGHGMGHMPHSPVHEYHHESHHEPHREMHHEPHHQMHLEPHHGSHHQAPPSGYRISLTSNVPFPPIHETGPPPFHDSDHVSPVFIGSAIFEHSVHPCKICPALFPSCRVPYGSSEHQHYGRFDLLPITPSMEWVHAQDGEVPYGRRPVEGGYEENGGKLYHALVHINGMHVPGKTGHHLGGASVAFGGHEHHVRHDYKILCWR